MQILIKRVVVLVSLLVAILIGMGNAFAHIPEPSLGPEWKLVFIASDGTTFYVDTRSITHLPGGIVKVRVLFVPRGKFRRTLVNDLNNDKRFWYYILLQKFNCKTHQSAALKGIFYSFGRVVLFSHSSQHEKWGRFSPGSPDAKVEKYVCKSEASIPEPSLSSNWKFIGRDSNGTTLYFNARKITYLPKGIIEVWKLMVPRGEDRRRLVHLLKNILLYEGKDPNNAERVWYEIDSEKVNCKTNQDAILEIIYYSFGQTVLAHHSFQHEKWNYIIPGSIEETEEKYACK